MGQLLSYFDPADHKGIHETFEHVVEYEVIRGGWCSKVVWMEEVRKVGVNTVRIIAVKAVPIIGIFSLFFQLRKEAESAKKELDMKVEKLVVQTGWTVAQIWSKEDRKVYFLMETEVDLVSCISFHDDDMGFLKSVYIDLDHIKDSTCKEGLIKFLMD